MELERIQGGVWVKENEFILGCFESEISKKHLCSSVCCGEFSNARLNRQSSGVEW